MHIEKHDVTVTTTATGGAGTGYTPSVTGRVLAIHYVSDAGAGYATTADFDISVEGTGEILWDQDNVLASTSRYPRLGVHDGTGVAATLDGTVAMRDAVHIANDRVEAIVSNAGNSKTGTFTVVIG